MYREWWPTVSSGIKLQVLKSSNDFVNSRGFFFYIWHIVHLMMLSQHCLPKHGHFACSFRVHRTIYRKLYMKHCMKKLSLVLANSQCEFVDVLQLTRITHWLLMCTCCTACNMYVTEHVTKHARHGLIVTWPVCVTFCCMRLLRIWLLFALNTVSMTK